jgi:signal transduction histidine kinase
MNKKTAGGIGLNNMHVRAGLLDGEIKITSETEKGTTIKFLIPVPAEVSIDVPVPA